MEVANILSDCFAGLGHVGGGNVYLVSGCETARGRKSRCAIRKKSTGFVRWGKWDQKNEEKMDT